MRVTFDIDDDVLDTARRSAERSGESLHQVINESLRKGLYADDLVYARRSYHMPARDMGLKQGHDLDHVRELLSRLEGETSR